jgi:hypothetical protein
MNVTICDATLRIKMTHDKTTPVKLAKTLICRHVELGSWKAVADEYGSQLVKPGTLNRIANSGGAWMPKKDIILIALGVKKRPQPPQIKPPLPAHVLRIRKIINRLAKNTRVAIAVSFQREKESR